MSSLRILEATRKALRWEHIKAPMYLSLIHIFTYSQMEQSGVMTPLVDLHCRYIGVSKYEDELTIQAAVKTLTPSRIEFAYRVYREGEEKFINTGETIHAWVDSKTFRPLNMKKRYPQWYEAIQKMVEEGI